MPSMQSTAKLWNATSTGLTRSIESLKNKRSKSTWSLARLQNSTIKSKLPGMRTRPVLTQASLESERLCYHASRKTVLKSVSSKANHEVVRLTNKSRSLPTREQSLTLALRALRSFSTADSTARRLQTTSSSTRSGSSRSQPSQGQSATARSSRALEMILKPCTTLLSTVNTYRDLTKKSETNFKRL